MKHTEKNLSYTARRRGRSLDATGAGPYIKLGIVLLALIVLLLAIVFLIVPLLRGSIEWRSQFTQATPAPAADAPTPAVPAILTNKVQSLMLAPEEGEAVLVDASIGAGELVYASGASEDSCDRIVRLPLAGGRREVIVPQLHNDCIRSPRGNADYLVWFDAKAGGGGSICLRSAALSADTVLVQLSAGIPTLYLDGQYLVFKAESGLGQKLYAIDLKSFESITLAVLSEDADAVSAPAVSEGRVCFCYECALRIMDLVNGTDESIAVDSPLHDPRPAAGGYVWLSANHDESTDLYYRGDDGSLSILARGVIDARCTKDAVAYGRDGSVYAYSLANKRFYMLSGAEEYAQLVAAGDHYVLWRVLREDSVSYRYLKVSE